MAKESFSIDNQKIELMANLELPQEMKILTNKKFDGIGLFRTEYLFTDRPDFQVSLNKLWLIRKLFRNYAISQ